MSQYDEETLLQIKQSNLSKVCFADGACPFTAPSVPATPSTPDTETTTVTSPSTDDLYTDAIQKTHFSRKRVNGQQEQMPSDQPIAFG